MISQQNTSLSIMNQEDSICKNEREDRMQRIVKQFRVLIEENDKLDDQIDQLRANPMQFINPIKNQLKFKIKELRDQNSKLKRIVQESKMPVYTQMKRKSFMPNENNDRMERDSIKSSVRGSLRGSLNGRSAMSQINSNSNYDKIDNASTCFNEEQKFRQAQQQVNPILKLQKPSTDQEVQRERLTHQIHYLIAKTEIFENTISEMKSKEDKQCHRNIEKLVKEEPQLGRIQQYKKKLLRLLNKLKSREVQMDEMVKMYKSLHEETIKKLKESTEALKQLQEEKIDKDVESKYAEVLELQERIQIINAELEQMDQQKWLQKAYKQLAIVFKRLGIPIPKSESVRSAINQLCQILIEHHLMCKQDHTQKLTKLKEYHEEQKQNNQKLIQNLKTKEQTLNKKLNTIQMQKGSNKK